MGTSARLSSKNFTNSLASKEREMALPFKPPVFFGFASRNQYSYNVYHQLANNGASFGARGARWARVNNIQTHFIPPTH